MFFLLAHGADFVVARTPTNLKRLYNPTVAPGTDNSEELSKFKIADKRHRPTLFKSTPSSSNLLKGKKGDGGGAGATGVSDVKEEAVSRTTVVKDAIVDPSMTPYVYKQKPEVSQRHQLS